LSYTPEEVTTLAQGAASLRFVAPADIGVRLVELVVVLILIVVGNWGLIVKGLDSSQRSA